MAMLDYHNRNLKRQVKHFKKFKLKFTISLKRKETSHKGKYLDNKFATNKATPPEIRN